MFSNEKILATVIKYTVEQYKDLSIEEIVPLIGKAELEREVSAGMTNVPGSELSDIKEHTVRFDLFVPVRLPESAVCTGSTADSITFRIFYDLEMQREWKPAYLLEKRVLYYAARMVSAQKKNYHGQYRISRFAAGAHGMDCAGTRNICIGESAGQFWNQMP